ncbi:hypothetical protein [Fretibacter rubidus]|uniref:hypothetical protein n=1 Tax=Fretibacter rubidus TaxID=570162 RepID=UPI00352A7101
MVSAQDKQGLKSPGTRAPIARLILAGLVLTGIPILSVLTHLRSAPDDHVLIVPATITPAVLGPRLTLGINTVDINALAGDDRFKVGDVAYVHTAVDGTELLYPFAISQARAGGQDGTVSFRGIVTRVDDNQVSLDYQFEDLASRSPNARDGDDVKAEISVNARSVARLKAIIIDGTRTPYDLMEKPVLFGRTINGAKSAPAM